jgi:hypothetical protein
MNFFKELREATVYYNVRFDKFTDSSEMLAKLLISVFTSIF